MDTVAVLPWSGGAIVNVNERREKERNCMTPWKEEEGSEKRTPFLSQFLLMDIDIPEEKTSTKTSNDAGAWIPVAWSHLRREYPGDTR